MKRILGVTSFVTIALGFVVLNYQACGRVPMKNFGKDELGSESLASADLKSQALNVLDKNCTSCHNSSYSSGTNFAYANDLNKIAASSYIVPGNPAASSLYYEIINGQMPPGNPLNSDQAAIIYDWISSLPKVTATPTPTPTPVVTPTPAATPTPVATPKPTVTPAPTATPVPTATPRPTVTPTPTPTPTPAGTPANATFTYINSNILKPRCAGCHGSAGGVSYASYASATAAKSVIKGNPESSGLYTTTKSGSMPTSGAKLTATETELIRVWILNGAPNN
jgi:mono/diheme cytochrome c family protein